MPTSVWTHIHPVLHQLAAYNMDSFQGFMLKFKTLYSL